jgi:4-amino-4-deoxy-L-arabinose transferase-like glycosyltransferase
MRMVWVLVLHPPFEYVYSDMAAYLERASDLADGEALERFDAFYPPGTHLVLAAPLAVFGTGNSGLWAGAALWAVLTSATPFFVWRLARILLSRPAAALAAFLCALWPLHVTSAGYFLSETPALAFLAAALWAGYRSAQLGGRRSLAVGSAAGFLGGVAVANRPQLLLNLAVLSVPWLRNWRRFVRPLVGVGVGVALVSAAVVAHNSVAAGKFTGVSENSGLTFFLGHCDADLVVMGQSFEGTSFYFGAPVAAQRGGGRNYAFPAHLPWEQGFFFRQGAECIRDDGLGHTRILVRSLADLTATTILWPQVNETHLREVVNLTNVAYAAILPLIAVGSVHLIRLRRRRREAAGEAVLLAQLLCVVLTAILFFGDPRFRMPYDIFGLTLVASLLAHWLFDQRRAHEIEAA